MKKSKRILLSNLLLISIFNLAFGQNETYSEVLETTFEKNIKSKNPSFKKKQENLFVYRNGKLEEERKVFFFEGKDIHSKYVFSYYPNGKLKSKKFFSTKKENVEHEEIFTYDKSGNWKINDKGQSIETTKVVSRKADQLIAESNGRTRSSKITVTNNGKDSIVLYRNNPKHKIKPRISEYKKNEQGAVISEKTYNTIGDSSLFFKTTDYHYLNDSKNWDYNISNFRFIDWKNKECFYRDSVTRKVITSTKKTNLRKKNMVGNWNMKTRKKTTFKLYENMEFEIIQNGKTTSAGKWKLNEPERKFTLIFEKGDPKGERHECKIIEIFEDQLIMNHQGKAQTFIRI